MKKFVLLCTTALLPSAAFAQSTGQVTTEIVITGTHTRNGVDGIVDPDGTKSRAVLTQQFIAKQRPGQSIDDTINFLPGVSFQNNDPYGSSGGTLTIHGFDASRISQTFDGIPLNDTGNYALYSNQQLDPELIEQVNVNLGTTDVDSPTAAATGSTVNYRSINPTDTPHVRVIGSLGDWAYARLFAVVHTGKFTPWGTKAWFSGSWESNENPFQRTSKTNKHQYNAKIYQPIGSNGDFISVAGHWNANRNGNFSSVPLRTDPYIYSVSGTSPNQTLTSTARVVGSGSTNRFPLTADERDYTLASCTTAPARTGVADVPNSCGTAFDYGFNPSNTGNIRINSRFTLAKSLILTVDPSFQYVKANGGGGSVKGNEGFWSRPVATAPTLTEKTPIFGYIGGQPYFGGVDLNGDTDILDTSYFDPTSTSKNITNRGVELYAPSETKTHRYGVIANLIYNFAPNQTVRLNFSHDYGRHRQTGEVTRLQTNGHTTTYFPENDPILDPTGLPMEKRNRLSYAILNQVSGEYNGRFMDRLTVNLGLRSPWFKRDLNNFCVTEAGGSFVDCFNDPTSQALFLAANPTYTPPTRRVFKFHKLLPTAGVSYDLAQRTTLFASYNKGLQVPGTDNLYQSLGFAPGSATPTPETTDNFEGGVRYTTSRIQAQLSGWYTVFNNRLASSYDPLLDVTVYRNLGTVHKYGIDADVAYRPIPPVTLYAFGSILKSKILDNVESGKCSASQVTAGASAGVGNCTTVGQPIYYLTAGRREGGSPTSLLGARAEYNGSMFEVGAQAKYTGPRYVNDQNLPIVQSYTRNGVTTLYQVYGAKAPGYTLVDLDARIYFTKIAPNKTTYLQLNLTNVFDKLFVAGFTPNTATTSIPFSYVGSPRTFSASLNMEF